MTRRIMIIDDDRDICDALAHRLEVMGYEPIAYTDGCSALSAITLEHERSPTHLVLLDLHMPGMDGMAVLREMKMKHPQIPVIIMSGTSLRDGFEKAIEAGACDWIGKPIDFPALRSKVDRVFQADGEPSS